MSGAIRNTVNNQSITLEQAYKLFEYNDSLGLYPDNDKYIRVYATLYGGKYNGQITSLHSGNIESQLNVCDKLVNMYALTTKEGIKQLIPERAQYE